MEAPTWLKKFSSSTKKKRARSPPIEGTTEAADTQPHQTQRSQEIQSTENGDDLEYMSEALLAVEAAKESVPRFPLKKTANTKPKPLKEIMHVALEEGLVKPLDQSNLGFKMVRLIFILGRMLTEGLLRQLYAVVKDGFSRGHWPWKRRIWKGRANHDRHR
jgi:hypothetical protein